MLLTEGRALQTQPEAFRTIGRDLHALFSFKQMGLGHPGGPRLFGISQPLPKSLPLSPKGTSASIPFGDGHACAEGRREVSATVTSSHM